MRFTFSFGLTFYSTILIGLRILLIQIQMPTKKQNKLRVAKTGRVELVLEDEGPKDQTTRVGGSAKAVGSVKAAGSAKAAGSGKAGGSGKSGGKAKSSGKAKTAKEAEAAIEHSESDEGDDLDLTESESIIK